MQWLRLPLLSLLGLCVALSSGCGDDLDRVNQDRDFSLELVPRSRFRRQASIEDRKACAGGEEQPKTRVDTTERLLLLRNELNKLNLDAFLVPSGDSHQSEYIAPFDKRREWVGGFSGSNGFGIVTLDQAAMWVDGRYYLQAEDELDCNWLFMKGAEGGDSGWVKWLSRVLTPGSRIGADATLTGASTWLKWQEQLDKEGFELVPLEENPIDQIWDKDRPERNREALEILELEFAGETWESKVERVRASLSASGHDAIVLTALDEVAWMFNLRGRDIPYNPVFRAYAIVAKDKLSIFLPPEKQSEQVKSHLKTGERGGVEIHDYLSIFSDLSDLVWNWDKVLLGKKSAYTGGASYAIYQLIPADKRDFAVSPVMLMKSRKNPVEVAGMKRSHIRDAVAVIEMAEKLERGLDKGEAWDELKVSKQLKKGRARQKHNKGISFQTISAYGANGAIIHYKPNKITNTKIGKDNLFLLDSGGQYKDGTTDVTRTFHFGTPTDFQREAYTRNVRIYAKEEHELEVGQFFSDEPGYYQPGEFGIRLETVLTVVPKNASQLVHQGKEDYGHFLGFEAVCLVPYEPKLIDFTLFNADQLHWFNRYNERVRNEVGPVLKEQKLHSAYKWMFRRTEPVPSNMIRDGRVFNESGCLGSPVTAVQLVLSLICANLVIQSFLMK